MIIVLDVMFVKNVMTDVREHVIYVKLIANQISVAKIVLHLVNVLLVVR